MKLKNRASMMGIIFGAICGIGGLVSGIYIGVIKPLQENGGTSKLPVSVIATGIALIVIFIAYLTYFFIIQWKNKKNRPPEW